MDESQRRRRLGRRVEVGGYGPGALIGSELSGAGITGKRPAPVVRLLRSMAFRRSREASAVIVDDPDSLRDLTEEVRERGYTGPLEDMAPQIDAALNLLEDRAQALEDAADDPATTPDAVSLPPARAARQRLVVATLHYLARKDDVIADDAVNGEVDDAVVVREVLGSAQPELEPYLERQNKDLAVLRGTPDPV